MVTLNCVTKETFCAWGDKAIEREKKRERESESASEREREAVEDTALCGRMTVAE